MGRRGPRRAAAAAFAGCAMLMLGACSQHMSESDETTVQASELAHDFTNKHQGPSWILAREQQFKLAQDQVTSLKALQSGMDERSRSKVAEIKAAFQRFKADSAVKSPDAATLAADLKALSDAQLAQTVSIIDGAIQGYAVLTPAQKKQFDDLIACCTTA